MSAGDADYDWRRLPLATRPYAEVIGDPISQSKSPAIHNFWLGKLGIDAEYRAAHVRAEELAEYLAARRADPLWRGCNVTMPHKQAVMGLVEQRAPLAERVGAVNTVVRNENDILVGHNTDAYGFREPLVLEHGFNFTPYKRVLVIGNGGAARAVVAQLAQMYDELRLVMTAEEPSTHVALTLAVRDPVKGSALLSGLEVGASHGVANIATFANPAAPDAQRYNLVVNTSPLGMVGNPPLAFDLSHVAPGGIVYDIVTAPPETPLLLAAKAAGFAAIDGLAMLIGQARDAFFLFFGRPPKIAWDAELRRILTA